MQHNVKDPMLGTGPDAERRIFEAFSQISSGCSHENVIGASMNLLVNALRQNCATRQQAERAFDELVGRAKNLLLEKHYDPVSNKRRNVFPFTQHVHAELVHFDDSFNNKR